MTQPLKFLRGLVVPRAECVLKELQIHLKVCTHLLRLLGVGCGIPRFLQSINPDKVDCEGNVKCAKFFVELALYEEFFPFGLVWLGLQVI